MALSFAGIIFARAGCGNGMMVAPLGSAFVDDEVSCKHQQLGYILYVYVTRCILFISGHKPFIDQEILLSLHVFLYDRNHDINLKIIT